MSIPESVLWIIGEDGCTAVKIFCSKDLRQEVADRFAEIFGEEYEKVMDLVEAEYGKSYEREENINPFLHPPVITDYGVFARFDSLAMYCGEIGDHIAPYNAGEALQEALNRLQDEFPTITYDGYVAFCWADTHSGDVIQYRITSESRNDKDDVTYDFVGDTLSRVFSDENAWQELYEDIESQDFENYNEVCRFFDMYSEYIQGNIRERLKRR